jgi:trimethylamine corrinoid protein
MAMQEGTLELIQKTKSAIISLNEREVITLAEKAAATLTAADLLKVVEEGFTAGIKIVGDRFGNGEMFLPELVAAAECMRKGFEIIEPKLREGKVSRKSAGNVVLATVKGDLHDIGKSMVKSLLIANAFEVTDLGTDVPTEIIIQSAQQVRADIIGVSALLTTTIVEQKNLITMLHNRNLRKDFKIMVGGAAASRAWAKEIGADGFGADANDAARLALELLMTH